MWNKLRAAPKILTSLLVAVCCITCGNAWKDMIEHTFERNMRSNRNKERKTTVLRKNVEGSYEGEVLECRCFIAGLQPADVCGVAL